MTMFLQSIRGRLTAWYALVLGVVLVAVGLVTYGVVERRVHVALDQSLTANVRHLAAELVNEADESGGVVEGSAAREVLTNFSDRTRTALLMNREGRIVAQPTENPAALVDSASLSAMVRAHRVSFSTAGGTRILIAPILVRRAPFVLVVAGSRETQEELLDELRTSLLATIPASLLVATLGGYLLARKSLAPMAAMTAKARAIGAENLAERVAIANPRDELGELGWTLNDLFERLEASFASQRRFMADASHELRSPVAVLQGELDVALSRPDRDARDYRESLEIMHRSVARLTRIVRDLFLLARGDAGEYPVSRERFYLDEVVANEVRSLRTLASDRGVTLSEQHDEGIALTGDENLIERLVANLVENAIKYTPRGGDVRVRCVRDDFGARIEVADSGPGIPPELQEKIFERFFRVDTARGAGSSGEEGSGAGLGLPIARWIAEVHGGSVRLERSDGRGTVFVARMPPPA
jgi:heavy metal sensor kinase